MRLNTSDRTQFATLTLAATHSHLEIALGATLGHAICAATQWSVASGSPTNFRSAG
ncbi:MAG: TMEM165/GDT1 family protein [Cyanobacteria bacterium P01_H01_bin.153]